MVSALAVLLLPPALLAQEPPSPPPTPPVVSCRACGSHGAVDCSKHGKELLLQEHAVEFCSAAAECKACGGALRVDCRQCRNEPVETGLQQRLALVREWRAARAHAVDEVAKGQPLLHLRTAHVDLAYGIRPLTIGRDKLDTHAGMHLYAQRLEELRARFLALLQAQETDLGARLQIYMCRDQQAQANLSPAVTGIGGGAAVGTKLMGVDAVYCMWQDPRLLPDDEALYRNLVHNTTHLLLANLTPAVRLGNPGNGWVDEGFAHWFEDQLTGKCTNYCTEEVAIQPGGGFHGGRWRAPVRKQADAGELTSCAELTPKNTDQLDGPQHAQAFAMVDFLLQAHGGGAKFRAFVLQLKQAAPMRDALQKVYGFGPLQFDTEFVQWVKANYSPQEPPR
jgi:hypothetical protein